VGSASIPGRGKTLPSRLDLVPTPPIQQVPLAFLPEVMRTKRETGKKVPRIAKINNSWIYIYIYIYVLTCIHFHGTMFNHGGFTLKVE
jgi:hypothetical protein